MSKGDGRAVGGLYFVRIEPFGKTCDWAASKVAFHAPDAGLAQIEDDATMTIVFFLTVEVKQLLDHRRDPALLRADVCMSGVHFQSSSLSCAYVVPLRMASSERQ